MKNLLIYTGPNKEFDDETANLAKIQIDNSLDLGWKREDILLVTDFDYEYNGLKSFVIKRDIYYSFDIAASKTLVILYLLNQGIIQPGELYWCHDFDAYENVRIDEVELGLESFDLGLTHYTYKPEWQCSSIFFKESSKDIFELLDNTTRTRPHLSRNNEKTLTWLINHNSIDKSRHKRLNVTYNIPKRYIATTYKEAEKPLRILHFLPSNKDQLMPDTALNMFMYGKNGLKIPLMNDRLIRVFNKHGIK